MIEIKSKIRVIRVETNKIEHQNNNRKIKYIVVSFLLENTVTRIGDCFMMSNKFHLSFQPKFACTSILKFDMHCLSIR